METVVLRPYLIDGELIKDFFPSFLCRACLGGERNQARPRRESRHHRQLSIVHYRHDAVADSRRTADHLRRRASNRTCGVCFGQHATVSWARGHSLSPLIANFILNRCGATLSVFFMEVGRFTTTGPGEIWMETFDPLIASNMSDIILQWVLLISVIHNQPRRVVGIFERNVSLT